MFLSTDRYERQQSKTLIRLGRYAIARHMRNPAMSETHNHTLGEVYSQRFLRKASDRNSKTHHRLKGILDRLQKSGLLKYTAGENRPDKSSHYDDLYHEWSRSEWHNFEVSEWLYQLTEEGIARTTDLNRNWLRREFSKNPPAFLLVFVSVLSLVVSIAAFVFAVRR